MKRHLLLAASLLAASHAVLAQGLLPDERPKTCAEVLADLTLYERSGLQAMDHDGDSGPDVSNSPRYRRAVAEYRRLRSSPEYTALVQRIAAERGEPVANVLAAPR